MGKVLHTKGIGGGGGTGTGWSGQVEFRGDLPITLGDPAIGDIWLVEKKTTLLGFTTYQSGLYIRDFNTGALSDWRRLNVKVNFTDSEFALVSAADTSKKAMFDLGLLTTSTTRVYTYQDKNYIIAGLDDLAAHGLPTVLSIDPTTGAFDISIDTGQVIKATTGSSVLQLKQGDSFIQDGAFGVDDVSLFSLSTVASCLALLKSNFTKVGQFCVYNNDASDVNTGGVVNYPCASASQNWTIKQNVTNVLTSSGKNGIAKTDDSLYCNQLAYNTGLAGELIVNHTPSATDYTQTHQGDDGIIALTKDIPKAFFAVNLDSAESSISRVFAGGRTTFTATHNLDTLDLKPEVFRLSDGRTLGWRVERTGVNTVEVSRNGNIADGLFRILI
jgi:hypothetical protein